MIFRNANDPSLQTAAPNVQFGTPTGQPTFDAGTAATLAIAGGSSAVTGTTICHWANSLGGSGICTTAANGDWSVGSVPLTVGSNVLTTTCWNSENIPGSGTLTVARSGSGTSITNGQSLTIAGASFGTKSTAAPFVFERWAAGSFTAGKWSDTFPQADITTTQRRTLFSQNLHRNYQGTLDGNDGHLTINSAGARTWYTGHWLFLATNWTWGTNFNFPNLGNNLANVKVLRWSGTSYPTGDHDSVLTLDTGDGNWYEANQDQVGVPNFNQTTLTRNTWHFLEQEYIDSSAANAADGSWKIWLDRVQVLNQSGVVFKLASPYNGAKRPYDLAFWNSWGDGATDANDYYQTDVYVDSALSRVYLGDASTLAACTHVEVQPATAWADTSVTVTVNQGSFSTGNTVFVYVLDATGASHTPSTASYTIG